MLIMFSLIIFVLKCKTVNQIINTLDWSKKNAQFERKKSRNTSHADTIDL